MTSIENLLLQTHLNQTTIALNPTSIFQSLGLLPYTGLLGTLLTLTAHHLLLNFPVFQSFHLLKNANQFCDFLRTALDNAMLYDNAIMLYDNACTPFSAEGYYSQLLSMV